MAEFITAYKIIIKNEGGYVDDPNDAGGETYCGISRNNFPNWNGWGIIDIYGCEPGKTLNDADLESAVRVFYKQQFWDKIKGDNIDSQAIATAIFDWNVNSGIHAIKSIQRIVGVEDDGICGSGTIRAINDSNELDTLNRYREAREVFYRSLAASKPSQAKFLNGWLNRVENLYNTLA